jgi:thiamine-monophosphate kinase
VALGMALRGIATAAIDVSDGLLGDLGHLLKQSGAGATIDTAIAMNLIAVSAYGDCANKVFDAEIKPAQRLGWVLAGGDDYELLFTAPAAARAAVAAAAQGSQTAVTRIGRIDAESGLRLVDGRGQAVANPYTSFDHFA